MSFFGIPASCRKWPTIKLCRNVVASQFNWPKAIPTWADFINCSNSIDIREPVYLPYISCLSLPHIFLRTFGNVIFPRDARGEQCVIREREKLAALTASEVKLRKHDPISRIVQVQPWRFVTVLFFAHLQARAPLSPLCRSLRWTAAS